MLATNSHDDLAICKGLDCIMNDEDFIKRTETYLWKWAKQVCEDLELPENAITTKYVSHKAANYVVRLCDFHFLISLTIQCDREGTKDDIIEQMIAVIDQEMEELKEDKMTTFNEFTFILSWMATWARDSELLNDLLANQDFDKYPKCHAQSLLINSVRNCFSDGVEFLLNWGAKPNLHLWEEEFYSNAPIPVALNQFERVITRETTKDKEDEDIEELEKIVEILVTKTIEETGQSPFLLPASSDHFDTNAYSLVALPVIAMASERCSKFLFHHGSAGLVSDPEAMEDLFGDIPEMLSLFTRYAFIESYPWYIVKWMNRLILPLIRSGVTQQDADIGWKHFDRNVGGKTWENKICKSVWGRLGVFTQILVETCVYEGGKVPTCFNRKTKPWFPMSLSQTCRRSILKVMPVGLDARTSAIASLDLPEMLKTYLTYPEFEPIMKETTD